MTSFRRYDVGDFLAASAAFAAPSAREQSLMDAVKGGNVAARPDLNRRKSRRQRRLADSSAPLHWAVEANNLEIANLLIAAGANVKADTRYNITPLSLACSNGNAKIIERLLAAGADANGISEEGQTALMTASLNGNVDAIKVLLKHGAKVNATEPFKGQTRVDVGGGRKQRRRDRDVSRVRRRREGEVQSRLHAAAVRGAE